MAKWNLGKLGCFLGGVLVGTAGVAILTSEDAKKVYTHCTAAVMRGKDQVMKQVTAVRENCEDIAADAAAINEERALKQGEQEIADLSECAQEACEEKADHPVSADAEETES